MTSDIQALYAHLQTLCETHLGPEPTTEELQMVTDVLHSLVLEYLNRAAQFELLSPSL